MVFILDGISEYVAHVWRKIDIFGEKNRFVTALDQLNALNRSNNRYCVPINELPSNKSTMATRPKLIFSLLSASHCLIWYHNTLPWYCTSKKFRPFFYSDLVNEIDMTSWKVFIFNWSHWPIRNDLLINGFCESFCYWSFKFHRKTTLYGYFITWLYI